MCKKVIFLTSLIVVLTCLSTANARYQLKVDLTISDGGEPVAYTDKSQQPGYEEDWTPWVRWGADLEGHDATRYEDLGGTGLSVGLGMWKGGGPSSTVLDYTIEGAGDDPICNTWLRSREDEQSSPAADCHIVLYGDSLIPGTYWVYGFHNTPGGDEEDMPRVYAETYSGLNENLMQNVGAPNDPDGEGVIVIIDDEDVPILHVSDDNDLCYGYNSDFNDSLYEPNLSFVKFYTDGSPVIITYEAGDESTAVLNAFIINAPTPYRAYGARPRVGEQYVCPDANLTWRAGVYVQDTNAHNVYFGTDLTEEITLFDDDFEAGDANWVPSNWTLYDSNVLGDGNSDGNSHSTYHSMTPGSGAGTLTSDTIDTSEAGSTTVELWIKKSVGIEAGHIDLYYYDGNNWDFAADLNSIGPNDVWLHYTDEVNDSNYFVSTFKLELRSNISGGELFIDDVSVTNTWPIGDEWFKGNQDPCTYNPPGLLDFNTTYYWRVDEVNDSCDASPWQGHLWSFRTEKGKARDPDPHKSAGSKPTDGITLSWTPSCFADQHDIYLSTKFEEVNESNSVALLGTTYGSNTEIETGPLAFNRRYYWRVNETGPISLTESDIWYFQTIGYPLMYFKFDGVPDANIGDPEDANFVTDDTGNVTFDRAGSGELRYDQPNPTYNPGGTSGHFTPNGTGGYGNAGAGLLRSCFGGDLLDLDGLAYTIEAWIRQDGDSNYPQGDIEMDGTILRKDRFTYGLGIDDDGTVKFMHRGNIIASKPGRIEQGQWYHIAAVFDACAADANQREELYIDGLVVADNNDPCSNPSDDYSSDVVGIGAYQYQSTTAKHLANHFNGAIDELRVVDVALEPGDFLIRGDPNLAWLPRPYNYAKEVQCTVELEWLPGQYASSHDVYIGTNWDDINDVNTSNIGLYPNVDYNNVEVCSYDPWFLGLDQTYYWRVDEVNDACDPNGWRGSIWRFTVADYITIADMEDYDNIWDGWYYGADTWSNSELSLWTTSPLRGDQTMKFIYDNSIPFDPMGGMWWYFSEAETIDLEPNDWTAHDLSVLLLWFYGESDNATTGVEPMYVYVEDNSSNPATVKYGDRQGEHPDDIAIEEWQQWIIPLSSLNDANLADLYFLAIGFGEERYYPFEGGWGEVYFDDIRLYPGICIPEEGPDGDLTGDCYVNLKDVEVMAQEWLESDVNFGTVEPPNDANLVGWWKLDEGSGSFAEDSSDNDFHGTLEINDVNVYWVVGYDGNSALEFDGGRVRVPDDPNLRPMDEVSASAWINYSDEQNSARIVVKGADNKETFCLEVGDNDQLTFYVGDGNSYDPCEDGCERYFAESDDGVIDRDEWIHVAGTFDGNSAKCYINGEVAGTEPNAYLVVFLSQDTNDLAIGSMSDDDRAPFEGAIDDVRVYNYGLSPEEVAHIATDGKGVFAVQSVANIYNEEDPGDRAVDLRDFAVLANDWLVRKLYP